MFKKSPLKATKLHRQKRRAKILKITFIIVAILSVFGLSVWLSRISFLRLDTVIVKGNAAIDSQDIEFLAQKYLAGAYLGLYAKSNKLIYPKDTIEEAVRNTFPNINTLKIEAQGHNLQVSLTERKPVFIWCKGKANSSATAGCYFMDGSG
jgi:cell division septal protein FtsQ